MMNFKTNKMKTLLQKNWEERYMSYISDNVKINEELKSSFIELLKAKDLKERYSLWNAIKINLVNIKEIQQLANPYYIGFGNPNSDILFIGKEKAFDIMNSPELLLHESVNNTLQWELLAKSKKENKEIDSLNFKEEGDKNRFNPRFPQLYHTGKIKSRNTWGMYAGLVNQLIPGQTISKDGESDFNFFNHCFMTELNFKPSKYSKGYALSKIRKELLQDQFFKNFKYVIVGANAIITIEELKDLFQCDSTIRKVLLEKGKEKGKTVSIIETANQKIILCNQLSGAAGWTTVAIKELVNQIKSE